MNGWRWLLLAGWMLSMTGCEYEEVEREIGYQGAARRNPWLAAERMVARCGYDVTSVTGWQAPAADDATWFVPAAVLSNQSFVRQAEQWTRNGGHLVILLENAGVETNDWRMFGPELAVEPVLKSLLRRVGIGLLESHEGLKAARTEQAISFAGDPFQVAAGASKSVVVNGGLPGAFASVPVGRGLLTAVTDARMFRNRWIAEQEHAELLLALVEASAAEGSVVFIRGASQSFWGLVRRHLWAVLTGLCVLLALWLWRSLCRFGPLETATAPPVARGYDHHLAAIGNFHWQLDRAANLLEPVRQRLIERGQRGYEHAGASGEGPHQWLAARSGLPVARVLRALGAAVPADGLALTRIVADLQELVKWPQLGNPGQRPPPSASVAVVAAGDDFPTNHSSTIPHDHRT